MNNLDLSQAVDLSAIMHKAAEDKAKQLPEPTGYRMLCAIPEAEETYDSGILKSDDRLVGYCILHSIGRGHVPSKG